MVTGSFNFTKQAESNGENLLVIADDPKLVVERQEQFEDHLKHLIIYNRLE